MTVHTIELVCPMLTIVGIWADYLGRHYTEIVANKPLKSFGWEATIPTVFSLMLLGLALLVAVKAGQDVHSTPYWMTAIYAVVAVALVVFAGWAFVQLHNEKVSIPIVSAWIAGFLGRHEGKIKPRAETLGLPIATVVCLIEVGIYIFGALAH